MPGPTSFTTPPGPGYTWDPVAGRWVSPVSSGPTLTPTAPAPPPPAAPGATTAGGLTQGPGGGAPVAPIIQNFDNGVSYSDAYWKEQLDPTNTAGSASRDAAAVAAGAAKDLKTAAGDAGTAPRPTPVVSPTPDVTSGTVTAAKPTAAVANAPQPVTAGVVNAPVIAPIERIKAATVAQGPQAGAGYVAPVQVNEDAQAQFRYRQDRLSDALDAAATGAAPTAGELQARRLASDASADRLALAGSVHGYGALAANRAAGRDIANIQSKSALDQALLRQKGVEDARQQLAQVIGQGREQDLGLALKGAELTQGAGTTNAQLSTTVSISNADREAARNMKQADLEQAAAAGNAAAQNELNNRQAALKLAADTTTSEQQLKAAQGNQTTATTVNLANAANETNTNIVGATEANKVGLGNAENDLKAQLANADNATKVALANAGFTLEGRQIDDARNVAAVKAMLEANSQASASADQVMKNQLALNQINEAIKRGDQDAVIKLTTSIISGISTGAAAALSDRRAKTDIKKASGADLDDFLGALEAWTYKYKKPSDGEGKRMGPMAQELERSMLGKGMVKKGGDGLKRVDTNALTMALAGAVARLAKEQRRAGRGA